MQGCKEIIPKRFYRCLVYNNTPWDATLLRARERMVYMEKYMHGEVKVVRVLDKGSHMGEKWGSTSYTELWKLETIGENMTDMEFEEGRNEDRGFCLKVVGVLAPIFIVAKYSPMSIIMNISQSRKSEIFLNSNVVSEVYLFEKGLPIQM